MRLPVLVFLIVILVSSVGAGVSALEKSQPSDPRLIQPVTIECVNVRLHVVLEQISETTKVTIRCGRDNKDWQVRDIPVTVCTNDLALGKLLNSIAISTHLFFESEKVGKSTVYHIWRDRKRQKTLDDYYADVAACATATRAWNWDTVAKMKDIPDDKLWRSTPEPTHNFYGAMSSFLTALGPDMRARAMAGETLRLDLQSASAQWRGDLQNVFTAQGPYNSGQWSQPTADDAAHAIQPTQDELHKFRMLISGDQVSILDPSGAQNFYPLGNVASCLSPEAMESVGIPERPRSSDLPIIDDPSGNIKPLEGNSDLWDSPLIQEKIKLDLIKGKRPSCGELLAALAKATGDNIICEDFESQRSCLRPEIASSTDVTVISVLQAIDQRATHTWKVGFIWHASQKDKIILGISNNWPYHHRDIVSDAFLADLRQKMSGDGVRLDDFLRVMRLTSDQVEEWIRFSPDLSILTAYGISEQKNFWMLYDSLNAQERTQAQSESGIPLGSLHPQLLVDLLRQYNAEIKARKDAWIFDKQIEWPKEFPLNDEAIATITMRVAVKEGYQQRQNFNASNSDIKYPVGWLKKFSYNMVLSGTQNSAVFETQSLGPTGLPIYTPEREAALGIKPLAQDPHQ